MGKTMTSDSEEVLSAWVAEVTGRGVVRFEAIPGGGSRSSYVVATDDGVKHLLRVDNGEGPLSTTIFSIGREYRILTALYAAGYAVAEIRRFSPAHNALLMQFVEGKTSYQVVPSADRQRLIQSNLLRKIVELHAFDVKQLGLTEFGDIDNVGQAVERDLCILQDMYTQQVTVKEPELDFALHWLRHNIPDRGRRAALIHGDVGPGNFLFDERGGIVAIIDWEVAHMGHPLEDLAAVLCRSLGVPFGSSAEHIADYERYAGAGVDRGQLDYFVILVLTRWYIGLNLALSRPSSSQNIPILITYRQSVAHTLISTLARRYGIAAPAAGATAPQPSATAFLHDYIIDTLDAIEQRVADDAFLVDRIKGLGKLSKYLRDLLAYGPERERREEQDAIEALSGLRHADLAAAKTALCAGAGSIALADAAPLVRYLVASSQRKHAIWAAAMGSMAQRTLDY
jgi:aminoglycoside phosphotransferase (APT) family kinase protein